MGRLTRLSSFIPGAFREPVKPCAGCVRHLGPNSTGCPACDAKLAQAKLSDRNRAPRFFGKVPFGEAGWKVARGRRSIVYPVQLKGYACYMQQGLRYETTFRKRKQPLPLRMWTTLLDHKPKTAIFRGSGTRGLHPLSGVFARPEKHESYVKIKNKKSKFSSRPYLFSEAESLVFYHGDAP